MKKLLRQNLHKIKYALLAVSVQCFLVEVAWASDNGGLSVRIENLNISAENFYFQGPQQSRSVSGKIVSSEDNEGMPGVTVQVKGTTTGTATDFNGNYTIQVPSDDAVLVFRSIGFVTEEVVVGNQREINVTLAPDIATLKEVVVVGYGEQRRETVVGAVVQTNSEVLQRTGGVSDLATALTGNLPGLITSASTGVPGDEAPRILIRGQNSWNGAGPLILVDGVERPEFFATMDIGSVESISMLKDASATAVFGSRGANGVIIVTTKRGRTGKAEITARAHATAKYVSKLPGKYDAFDAIGVRNRSIHYELTARPESWADIIPEPIRHKYRTPANIEEAERYPNVDWQELLFRDYAMAYNANVGIRGGTEFVRYFASIDYQNEGDLFKRFDSGRGYTPGYNYDRLNFRSNLDFELTPTTKLQANLGGTYAIRTEPWGAGTGNVDRYWASAYNNAPDAYVPRYSNGRWGFYEPDAFGGRNSVQILATGGSENITTTRLSTNFVLEQDLAMLLKGLNFRGTLAVDNSFVESGRGVNDGGRVQPLWINPLNGQELSSGVFEPTTRFDFFDQDASWNTQGGSVNQSTRRLFYQLQLNQAGTIAENHNYSLMGLMNRQEDGRFASWEGAIDRIPRYREDWVFRSTYNYKNKYMVEYNGAYNGSEKFSKDYRFAFFSSGGVGWNISEENFMKSLTFVDILKLRASYGEVGDDQINARFLYQDQWVYGQNSRMSDRGWLSEESPYTWYRQTAVGNPDVRWETVYKHNLGVEFEFLNGLISGEFDVFKDNRKDILMTSGQAVPSYFGTAAAPANLGRVETQGYELILGLNHTFNNGLRVWTDFMMTHARNKVINRDDPSLLNPYQMQAGHRLDQARTHVSSGYYNTWDELYASTPHNANNQNKLPGNYHLLDYDGNGVIDNFDVIPYAYSGVPENTFNTNVGFEWKGFSAFVQFYGVNNVSRQVVFSSLAGAVNRVFDEGTLWSVENQDDADTPLPRWKSVPAGYNRGSHFFYDGSYLRLKNAEVAYNFTSGLVKRMGLQALRVYANGNNLLLWTKMPDDRESNFAGTGWASQGAYPTVRRVNLGFNVTF